MSIRLLITIDLTVNDESVQLCHCYITSQAIKLADPGTKLIELASSKAIAFSSGLICDDKLVTAKKRL